MQYENILCTYLTFATLTQKLSTADLNRHPNKGRKNNKSIFEDKFWILSVKEKIYTSQPKLIGT